MIADITTLLEWLPWLIIIVVGLVLSGLYSGLETGVYVLNKVRLDLRAEAGAKPARRLRAMLRKPDGLLTVLLIGTNVAEYMVTFAISVVFVLAGHEAHAEWYTMAVATPLLFILGESMPKNVFQRSAETLVYRFVWLLRASGWIFSAVGIAPLIRGFASLFSRLGRPAHPLVNEGLAAIVAEGQASGALTHAQSIMADRVMHLRDVKVSDVMRPMTAVQTAPLHVTRQQLIEMVRNTNYSRLPMVDRDGRIVGILDIYEVLTASAPIEPRQKMALPLYLPARATVTDALYHMQKEHAAMAVVTDKAGKHIGVATIKDLVEEIVGELEAW